MASGPPPPPSSRTISEIEEAKTSPDRIFKVAIKGEALLTSPRLNKGTAFTAEERKAFDLNGRLPYRVNSIDDQLNRAWAQFNSHETDIRKNAFLQSLKAQNWVLYYTLLSKHLKEVIPIIYTPTEADAIAEYSHLFRRSEGLYLRYVESDEMEEELLSQIRNRQIDLVVCSDAEAILGIGDQGVGGIGISTAKSVIYTLIGGFDPSRTLSVSLDVGTDNKDLLEDPLYVGWPNKRLRGEEYDRFIDKFVTLIQKHLPRSLLHFEDFGVSNAQRLLDKYRDKMPVFNDDIQGTGAVTLAALLAAIGVTKSKLKDQRIVIYGAGSAGVGIAKQIRDGMVLLDGLGKEEANERFWLIDKHGLINKDLENRGQLRPGLEEFIRHEPTSDFRHNSSGLVEAVSAILPNSHSSDPPQGIGLAEVVSTIHPTVLIGTSTHAGGFTKAILTEMAKHVERPIILPLSNPSRLVEVQPKVANEWTKGMALIATGSPFGKVKGPKGDYEIAECNNALIYPGIGLGSVISHSSRVTDGMIIAAAQSLASLSPALKDPDAALLPDFGDSPEVNVEVAIALAEKAFDEGVAGVEWDKELVRKKVVESRWEPAYGKYVYDPEGES